MKNLFFSKILIFIFLFGGLTVNAQVKVKKNRGNNKQSIKINRSHHYNKKGVARVSPNRKRVVVSKPNRPKVLLKRPNYNRHGYVWIEGHWKWSFLARRYIWKKARWKKIKRNHYWVPGFWGANSGGFFWVEGYWKLEI